MGISKEDLTLKDKLYTWWEGLDTSGLGHRAKEELKKNIEEASHKEREGYGDDDVLEGGERTDEPTDTEGKPLWSASRVKVAEKLWGDGFVVPYAETFLQKTVKPLGISKGMSVLDLTAGIGTLPMELARSNKAWVIGLEESPLLADIARKRAVKQKLSKQAAIYAYNSKDFKLKRKFDYIFSHEKIFTIEDKEKFLAGMRGSMKPGGQMIFTDYVADNIKTDGLRFWEEKERARMHLTDHVAMEKIMKSLKFITLPPEDLTGEYKHTIYENLKNFLNYAEKVDLDDDTRLSVKAEINFWSTRLQAIELGLRFMRFQGIKE